MKKKQNVLRFENSCGNDSGRVNLTAAADGSGVLVPAPSPSADLAGGWRPWHLHRRESVAETFLCRPSAREGISTIAVRSDAGEVVVAGVVDGLPRCALSVDGGSVTFESAGRRRFLRFAGGRWSVDSPEQSLMPRLTARAGATGAVSTGAIVFKGVSQSDLSLTASQTDELGRRLMASYETLAGSFASSGEWMQPMLVAVRLVGSDGDVSAVSAPLLMSPAGWQCAATLEASARFDDEGALRVDDLRMEASGYVIDLTFPEGIGSRAAFAEVVALPQSHVADGDAEAPVRIVSRTEGIRFSTAVPGATRRFSSLDTARAEALFAAAPEVAEAGTVIGRFDLAACQGTVQTLRCRAADAAVMKAASVAPAADVEQLVKQAIVRGAEFTAAAVAAGGDCVLWGDIAIARRDGGDSPAFFAAAVSEEAWQGAVEVTFASGEKVVTHFAGDAGKPLSLMPLVSYPSRDAVSWRLIVEAEGSGERLSVEVPLTADPAGSAWAGYISTTLSPLQLVPESAPLPAEKAAPERRYPSMLLLARASAPLRPVAALSCGTAAVGSIEIAVRSRSAWDAQRQRFLVFTAGGVLGVSASASTAYLGASRIDVALCRGAAVTAATPAGVVASCADRLLVCGSNSVRECARTERAVAAMCWCPALSMLALLDVQGNLSLLALDDRGDVAARTALPLPFAPEAIGVSHDGSLWIDDGSTLLRLDGSRTATTHVGLKATLAVEGAERPAGLTLFLSGSAVRGTATLTAGERKVVRVDVDGAVGYPLRLRLAAPPRRRLTLELDADVSADFRWEYAELSTVRARMPR